MRAPVRALFALTLLAAATAPARGQAPEDALLEAVRAGFDGAVTWRVPAPLRVTLVNPRAEEVVVRVVARSDVATAERTVSLPPGARKRVQLALVLEGEVRVEVREGDRPLAQEKVDYEVVPVDRHLLVLDGRPPAQWTGGSTARDDQVLRHTTIEAADAPIDAACYAAVAAVLLREADPSGWSLDQREALLEWVREGGLLLLADVNARAPALVRFFDGLPASAPEVEKLAGRAARTRRAGLGAVAAFTDDPLLRAATNADTKQRLGELIAQAAAARRYPRPSDEPAAAPLAGPGARTQLLVAGFVAAYFLAVGPVLALVLRRARRARLALVTALLVLGFTLLAPAVAGLVRTGRGEARHRSVLWVPAPGGGPALELGEVAVVSGGAIAYRLDLEGRGGRALSATVVESWTPGEDNYGPMGYRWIDPRPAVVRSARGPSARVEVSMPPWGAQRVFTHALRDDVRPVTATLTLGATDGVCTIDNASGATLEDAVIVPELEEQRHGVPPYVPVGDLAPGARREVSVPRSIAGRRRALFEVMDLPWDWQSWVRLGQPAPQQAAARPALRYRLLSRTRPLVSVSGPHVETVTHALRVDAVVVTPPRPRGFLGVRLADVEGAVVITPMKGGPADRAGLRADDVVLTIDGAPVTSSGELQAVVGAHAPGEVLTVVVRGADGSRREHRVRLARAPGE